MLDSNPNFTQPALRIGCDLVEIERIERLLQAYPMRFLNKIFTPLERAVIPLEGPRRIRYVAKRFAAKEAFAKALGTGIGSRLHFHDLQIFSHYSGQPYIEVSSELKKIYQIASVSISLSDERLYGIAFCVIQ